MSKLFTVVFFLFSLMLAAQTDKREGLWIEHWGVNEKTDINYHDEYELFKDSLGIWQFDCKTHQYTVERIEMNENNIILVLQTMLADYLPYNMTYYEDCDCWKGEATSVHGEKRSILWSRPEVDI